MAAVCRRGGGEVLVDGAVRRNHFLFRYSGKEADTTVLLLVFSFNFFPSCTFIQTFNKQPVAQSSREEKRVKICGNKAQKGRRVVLQQFTGAFAPLNLNY